MLRSGSELSGKVAEIRKAASALEAAESHAVIPGGETGMLLIDASQRIVRMTVAAARIFGYSPGELLGQGIDVIVPALAGPKHTEQTRALAASSADASHYRGLRALLGVRKNGSLIHVEVALGTLAPAEEGGMYALVQQRSTPLAYEPAFRHAYQALCVLAAMHESLERATDVAGLCEAVCRVAVDLGGYAAAWVVRAEEDEARSLTWRASCGVPGELEVTFQVSSDARRLCGEAMREGHPVRADDSERDRASGLWPEGASEAGWRSAVALPLAGGTGAWGALVIESCDAGAFDENETSLLMELAKGFSRTAAALDMNRARQIAEARLAEVLDHADVVAWVASPDGRLLQMSGAVDRLLGAELARELRTGSVQHLLRGADQGAVAAALEDGAKSCEVEHRIVVPGAQARWWRTVLRVLRDPTGRATRIEGLSRDITEHRRAEEALVEERERSREALEQSNADLETRVAERTARVEQEGRAKDEFLAGMSHELRAPLNAILGLSELLVEEVHGPLNQEQRKDVRRIEESGRHLLSLINDLLDLSKIAAGKFWLEQARMNVSDVCHASIRLVHEDARRKRLRVNLSISESGTGEIIADERRLKQILVNLLSNAVKFTPEGGRMGLDVRVDEERGCIRFVVWDAGIGIAPEDQALLFQPFTQLKPGLAHGGTGLGLALVRQLSELHGGEVQLESRPGEGSRFTITLPLVAAGSGLLSNPPSSAGKRPGREERARIGAGRRVLLVDDDEANIDSFLAFLTSRGFTVDVAQNGVEAVGKVREAPPDIVLMDVQMPVMDGLTAMRALRADPAEEVRRVPIIALTAIAMDGDRNRCLSAGADGYLAKPASLQALLAMMNQVMKVKASSRSA